MQWAEAGDVKQPAFAGRQQRSGDKVSKLYRSLDMGSSVSCFAAKSIQWWRTVRSEGRTHQLQMTTGSGDNQWLYPGFDTVLKVSAMSGLQ
jgi:hypothetical protein